MGRKKTAIKKRAKELEKSKRFKRAIKGEKSTTTKRAIVDKQPDLHERA